MMAATLDVMASGTADEQPSDVALAAAGDRRAFERLYRTHDAALGQPAADFAHALLHCGNLRAQNCLAARLAGFGCH